MSYTKDPSFVVPLWIENQAYEVPTNHPRFDVTKPPSQEKIWSAQSSTPEIAQVAVKAASKALKSWSKTSISERREIFEKVAQLLEERKDEVEYYMEQETGAGKVWLGVNLTYCKFALKHVVETMEDALQTEQIETEDGMILT